MRPDKEEVVKTIYEGKQKILNSSYKTLRIIKEHSLVEFHKRFSRQILNGSKREKWRQVTSWLDKEDVQTWAPYSDEACFYIFIPYQKRAFYITAELDEKKTHYNYEIMEVDKHLRFEKGSEI